MMLPTPSLHRFLLPALLVLGLASCSTARKHKPSVLQRHAGKTHEELVLRDDKLSRELRQAQDNPATAQAATERFIVQLQKRVGLHDWNRPLRVEGRHGSWRVSFNSGPPDLTRPLEWPPHVFDRMIPASEVKLEGYHQVVAKPGVGAPFVLALENIDELKRGRSFRPGNGAYSPGTVVLDFGASSAEGGPAPVSCRVFNTFDHRRAKIGGKEQELACNVTAAVEMSLDNKYLIKNQLAGLLSPGKRLNDMGLFGLHLYDPAKSPVVFVHGLKSDPHIWKNAVNEIYADEKLAARFQPLLFLYPSGLSVPASALRLRETMHTYRETWDPEGDDPASRDVVLVGHSMGGLLSRLQVIDSGDEMWRAFFNRPVKEVPWLTKEEERRVEAALHFKPMPGVRRAVFVAVPHRGSKMADLKIVQLAIRLIKLPGSAASLATNLVAKSPNVLNPALLKYHSLGLRSVDMLSPEHPYFAAIEKRPITVPYHSIIGDSGKGRGPDCSDGVVPYWSSHLDGAQSELFVPYGHSCTAEPETVAEIVRILRLHARDN